MPDSTFDLVHFSLEEVVHCGGVLQRAAAPARSFEEAAQAIVQRLYQDFFGDGGRAFVLVRLFATQAYGRLPPDLRDFARRLVEGRHLSSDQKCLVLIATAGDRAEWNMRHGSVAHQVIPLESDRLATAFPMVSQLLAQLGAVSSAPTGRIILEHSQRTYNVFYVQRAEGSPQVVDQEEFVRPFGIRSAIGFGGALPSGETFAVVAFSRVEIPPQVAELFRYLALNAKLALLPFDPAPYLRGVKAGAPPTVHDTLVSLSVQGVTAADLLRTYVTIAADWLERSRVLAELSGELASVLHVDEALEVFRRLIVTRVADGVSIELEGGPLTRLVQPGKTVVLQRLLEGTDPELLTTLVDAACAVAIPLRTRGQVFGAVAMQWVTERSFEPMFISYVEELANRFAMTLDSARLFATTVLEHQRAREEATFAERLLAIVSHDLRNPLTAIRLASRALADRVREPDQLGIAQQIVRSSERMMRLIGQLLDFARLHRGMSLPMKFESAHLHQIAQRIVDEARHGIPSAQIELDAVGRDDLICDVVGVEAIVANLLYNAIQHGATGPITITIREAGSDGLAIDVHNPGPPIPADMQATMFEAFRRGPPTDGPDSKRLGLGLYIAREILRAHGGTISVRSPDRDGTTFSVLLPRIPRAHAEQQEPATTH
jgi:signal transduction histidine kinase